MCYVYIYIFNMAVEYENLKEVKPLNESNRKGYYNGDQNVGGRR